MDVEKKLFDLRILPHVLALVARIDTEFGVERPERKVERLDSLLRDHPHPVVESLPETTGPATSNKTTTDAQSGRPGKPYRRRETSVLSFPVAVTWRANAASLSAPNEVLWITRDDAAGRLDCFTDQSRDTR